MSGGIRKRDIQLLLVVAGILLAVLAYYLGYKKLEEKTAKVDNENLSLQQQVRPFLRAMFLPSLSLVNLNFWKAMKTSVKLP